MNKATQLLVKIFGVIFGISGINHGMFEALQGNTSTEGVFISAIGEAQRMWPHGNEYAFTLVQNFLVTGLISMALGAVVIVWSAGYVHKKNGPMVFLLLFIALLLLGGGVAQTLFFPGLVLVSTRIQKPLTWWRKVLPAGVQQGLRRIWAWALAASSILLLCVLVIGVTGFVPGVPDSETVLSIMLAALLGVLVTLPLAVISGFAKDILSNPGANT
jgi:hypothetical protein